MSKKTDYFTIKNMKTWMGLLAAMTLSLQSLLAQAPPPPEGEATVAAPAPGKPENAPSVPVNISPTTAEVIKLAESGLGDEVVMAYITNSQTAFNLSGDISLSQIQVQNRPDCSRPV